MVLPNNDGYDVDDSGDCAAYGELDVRFSTVK